MSIPSGSTCTGNTSTINTGSWKLTLIGPFTTEIGYKTSDVYMNGVPYFGIIGAFTYNLSFFSAWLWAIECYAMLWGGGSQFSAEKRITRV